VRIAQSVRSSGAVRWCTGNVVMGAERGSARSTAAETLRDAGRWLVPTPDAVRAYSDGDSVTTDTIERARESQRKRE